MLPLPRGAPTILASAELGSMTDRVRLRRRTRRSRPSVRRSSRSPSGARDRRAGAPGRVAGGRRSGRRGSGWVCERHPSLQTESSSGKRTVRIAANPRKFARLSDVGIARRERPTKRTQSPRLRPRAGPFPRSATNRTRAGRADPSFGSFSAPRPPHRQQFGDLSFVHSLQGKLAFEQGSEFWPSLGQARKASR